MLFRSQVVIRATESFNLHCNNVARQVEEKCCPYYRTFILKLDRNTELARAVDVIAARVKRIYTLVIKVNNLFTFFRHEISKRKGKHFLRKGVETLTCRFVFSQHFSFSKTSTCVAIAR